MNRQFREGMMRLVIMESPYAGDVKRNVDYARACVRDCLRRGEAPLASHLLYTQEGILNDDHPQERALGIKAGHVWMPKAEAVVLYLDLGMSRGMREGVRSACHAGVPIEVRLLGGEWDRCAGIPLEYSEKGV